MKRHGFVIVVIVVLLLALLVMNSVVKAQKRVFTEHLLMRISEEVGDPPDFAVPDDLAARLISDGLFEWNGHLRENEAVLDIWGTPIRFTKHPLSGLIIQSAGKDAEFDNNDDHSIILTLNNAGQQASGEVRETSSRPSD